MQGYIKDYRKELESDIWLMPPLYHRVWQYLKYSVNHAENEIPMRDGAKFLIHKGQHLTSYRNISRAIGYYEGRAWKQPNVKTVKVICNWLEKNLMIHQDHGRGNSQYTLITLNNWALYQGDEAEEVTLHGEGRKHLVDINKNDKECIRNKYTCEFESFWKEYPRQIGKGDAFKCWKARVKEKCRPEDMIQAAVNYALECTKKGTETEFIKHPKTFLSKTKPFNDYISPEPPKQASNDSIYPDVDPDKY